MCAGKRRTLRATIVTLFSHMTRDVSVFVKYDTFLTLFFFVLFFWKLPQIRTFNFRKVVRQCTRYGGKYYMSFVGNLLLFPAVKEF